MVMKGFGYRVWCLVLNSSEDTRLNNPVHDCSYLRFVSAVDYGKSEGCVSWGACVCVCVYFALFLFVDGMAVRP